MQYVDLFFGITCLLSFAANKTALYQLKKKQKGTLSLVKKESQGGRLGRIILAKTGKIR